MAQKLVQTQTLQQVQTLSPQQVLQVKLLEMPVSELEQRVSNELLDNGALEENTDAQADGAAPSDESAFDEGDSASQADDKAVPTDEFRTPEQQRAIDDYSSPDDVPDYVWQSKGSARPEAMDYGDTTSFFEQMKQQMAECRLSQREKELMTYLIGSLDSDGLLKKQLSTLADEMEIYAGIRTSASELEGLVKTLQTFDPPGIGARSLRECLMIQVRRDKNWPSRIKKLEYEVLDKFYLEFTHKRWDRISPKLRLTPADEARIKKDLVKLNPRPGSSMGEVVGHNYQQIIPDFVAENENDGDVTFYLNKGRVPELRVSPAFQQSMEQASQGGRKLSRVQRETLAYTKEKIERARTFIEAVLGRRRTLTAVMQAIIDIQRPFFLEGDEALLKPMILKDVAERTRLDISTVSRATQGKYVETRFGTFPLKWFFSDSFVNNNGEELSSRRIQIALKEIIEQEDKKKPLSDQALTEMLKKKGFDVARRTVTKYREQIGFPIARLRK